MKQTKLLLLMMAFLLPLAHLYAAETESNNTRGTANTLAFGGSNTGAINVSGDEDWWSVATTSDGMLNVTITISNGLNMWCQIYDNDGVILLSSGYTAGTTTVSKDGLAAGTYYLRVYPYYVGQLPVYTISNTLTVPAEANDVEQNGTRALAKVLPLNNSKTGHINYYYNNVKDSFDWYRVTTNADGRLRLTMTSANTQNVWAYLYDNDGTTLLASGYTGGSAVVVNKDGLAAGTYYIMVKTYYTSGWAPYTLYDSLFTPAQANDTEPNATASQALTLPLNGSVTGHNNYYYNNVKDSFDWYKVTTNADGRLRLTMASGNGQHVWAYLYDNDGTTLLASSYTTGTADVVNKDGLAAGTYYIMVKTYYTSGWAPYTLSDSLFSPVQPNDPEPDSTRALALTLPLNGSRTGHAGYYYDNHRDSVDWYKVTTNADGQLNLSLTPANGEYVWIYLYDNNGTTLLNSGYSTTGFNVTTDGLTAGTYYVRVNCYYNYKFAPYTLSNTLSLYTNANDAEPNSKAYQAKTMPANGTVTGHVGFYYNNQRDSADWHKINYTGSGALTVTANFEPTKAYGYKYCYLQIWKDTLAAPIYNSYIAGPSLTANLTSLTQGYYWVRVITYYNYNFESYSLSNTFTQVTKAKIVSNGADTSLLCDSLNSITFRCTKSQAPYKVQLKRYGVNYGGIVTVNNANVTFNGLPAGSYSATAFGDGATGNGFGKSDTIVLMPTPTGTFTNAVNPTTTRTNWTILPCVKYYTVQYRKTTDTLWTSVNTTGNIGQLKLVALTAATAYEWQVQAVDSGTNGILAKSAFTAPLQFTTAASFAVNNQSSSESITAAKSNHILVMPNPAVSQFVMQTNIQAEGNVSLTLVDMNGKQQLNNTINAGQLKNYRVNVSNLAAGMYLLQVKDRNNKIIATEKVIVKR